MRHLLTLLMLGVAAMLTCGCSNADAAGPVTRAEFDRIFGDHVSFYTYDGFAAAFPAINRADAAKLLANVHHETGGLTIIEEDPQRRGIYCDADQDYGCPAGEEAYYGRGPIQLSWNYNYRDAGDDLGLDLLNNPDLVATDARVAWAATAWFWNKIPPGASFGETIRIINGVQECDGARPELVQSRVDQYLRITELLGVTPGKRLYC